MWFSSEKIICRLIIHSNSISQSVSQIGIDSYCLYRRFYNHCMNSLFWSLICVISLSITEKTLELALTWFLLDMLCIQIVLCVSILTYIIFKLILFTKHNMERSYVPFVTKYPCFILCRLIAITIGIPYHAFSITNRKWLKLEHHSSLSCLVSGNVCELFSLLFMRHIPHKTSDYRTYMYLLFLICSCICKFLKKKPEVHFSCQWKFSCSLPVVKIKYCILAEWAGAMHDLYCHHDCVECPPLFANCSLLVIRRVLILACICVRYFLRHHSLSSVGRSSSCYV